MVALAVASTMVVVALLDLRSSSELLMLQIIYFLQTGMRWRQARLTMGGHSGLLILFLVDLLFLLLQFIVIGLTSV